MKTSFASEYHSGFDSDGSSSTIQMEGFGVKTSGSIDVPLANSQSSSLATEKRTCWVLSNFEGHKQGTRQN
jgi:hypothetical protein